MTGPNRAQNGRTSVLPPILDLAKEIRDGRTPQSICTQYGIARTTLNGRFRDAGFILETGQPNATPHGRPEPLPAGHIGAGGQYVAGGDYQGLPTSPVRYRGKPRPNGIDWAVVDANYVANGGVIDPTIWPKTSGAVVTTDNNPRSRDAAHTHIEATHRSEPATPRPKRAPASRLELKRNPPNTKITTEMRPEVGRRYQAGESLPDLARAYNVSVTTIRNVLEAHRCPDPDRRPGRAAPARTARLMTPDDPRHGTRAGYIAGCRESNCRDANRRWVKRYRLNAARNGGSTTVSSGPIRQHVLELQETMSLCSIGAASGTSSSQLSRLLQGQHPRMRSTTAKALLAVRPNAKVGGHYVAAVGAQRRLQALVVIGYSFEHLERLLGGYGRSNIRILAYGGRTWITSDVATRIQKVYDAHWQIPVVGTSRVQRGAVTKVRRRAQAFGWAGPLAWDDDEIDSPDAQPRGLPTGTAQPSVIDEAKIQRRMAGDRTARTRGAESVEVVRRLLAAGHSQHWICEHTGLKTERYMPIIRAAQQAAEQSEPEQVAA